MVIKTLTNIRDTLSAQLCYQLFITPIPHVLEHEYRDFADRGCEFINKKRSDLIECHLPRHHVIHHFAQESQPNAKKVLIMHGWMSRAAYMVKFIRSLYQQGYDIYALDFPAHGEAKGFQLPWTDAVAIVKATLDNFGPFYGVIGHSFGGSMLLNTLILSTQLEQWELKNPPEKAVLLASPIRMRIPVTRAARLCGLNKSAYKELREIFRQKSFTKIENLNFRHFVRKSEIPILCIHGCDDATIPPLESKLLCRNYSYASLKLIPEVNHVDVLIDHRVEKEISLFFNQGVLS